jgi:hypothetical protein
MVEIVARTLCGQRVRHPDRRFGSAWRWARHLLGGEEGGGRAVAALPQSKFSWARAALWR